MKLTTNGLMTCRYKFRRKMTITKEKMLKFLKIKTLSLNRNGQSEQTRSSSKSGPSWNWASTCGWLWSTPTIASMASRLSAPTDFTSCVPWSWLSWLKSFLSFLRRKSMTKGCPKICRLRWCRPITCIMGSCSTSLYFCRWEVSSLWLTPV